MLQNKRCKNRALLAASGPGRLAVVGQSKLHASSQQAAIRCIFQSANTFMQRHILCPRRLVHTSCSITLRQVVGNG